MLNTGEFYVCKDQADMDDMYRIAEGLGMPIWEGSCKRFNLLPSITLSRRRYLCGAGHQSGGLSREEFIQKMYDHTGNKVLESFDGFRVGDKLTVRPDLEVKRYGNHTAVPMMMPFAGKTLTAEENGGNCVTLKECSEWLWTPNMFLAPKVIDLKYMDPSYIAYAIESAKCFHEQSSDSVGIHTEWPCPRFATRLDVAKENQSLVPPPPARTPRKVASVRYLTLKDFQ